MVPAMYMKACRALVCMARKDTAENVVNPPIIPRPQNGPGSKRPMRKQPMKLMMKMMMISAAWLRRNQRSECKTCKRTERRAKTNGETFLERGI